MFNVPFIFVHHNYKGRLGTDIKKKTKPEMLEDYHSEISGRKPIKKKDMSTEFERQICY